MVSVFVGSLLIVLMVLTCLSVVVDVALAIPWTVCSVQSAISFAQFFEKLKAGSTELFQSYAGKLQQSELSQASIAKSKETPFSAVDKQLPVDEVCCQFGAYVKLSCCKQPVAQPSTSRPVSNAFAILMSNRAAISQSQRLPDRIDTRNKKGKLFNDLVSLFEEEKWGWDSGGNTHGKQFLLKLRDVIWYIDGHHGAFENRSLPIPEAFKAFTGYNVPERSKHRKRKAGNMSYDVLISHVGTLKESLLTSWMQQLKWRTL